MATVGIGNGTNAGLLAVRILTIKYPELAKRLDEYQEKLREKVKEMNKKTGGRTIVLPFDSYRIALQGIEPRRPCLLCYPPCPLFYKRFHLKYGEEKEEKRGQKKVFKLYFAKECKKAGG